MGIKELEVVKTQRLSHSNQPLTANTIARGVMDLKDLRLSLDRIVSFCKFPSPRGVMDLKVLDTTLPQNTSFWFPSPRGVMDLKEQIRNVRWNILLVSVPSRGNGFERDTGGFPLPTGSRVSVPSRGNGFERANPQCTMEHPSRFRPLAG